MSQCDVAIEKVLLRLRRVPHGDREVLLRPRRVQCHSVASPPQGAAWGSRVHRDVESAPRTVRTEAVRFQYSSFGKREEKESIIWLSHAGVSGFSVSCANSMFLFWVPQSGLFAELDVHWQWVCVLALGVQHPSSALATPQGAQTL